MAEVYPTYKIKQPAPQSGIIWNLNEKIAQLGDRTIETLLGSLIYKFDNDPVNPSTIPSIPGMSLYLARFKGQGHQSPHKEDEIYYVIKGEGQITYGQVSYEDDDGKKVVSEGAVRSVKVGDLIFIPANTQHNFNTEDDNELITLVVFAPEYTGSYPSATYPGQETVG